MISRETSGGTGGRRRPAGRFWPPESRVGVALCGGADRGPGRAGRHSPGRGRLGRGPGTGASRPGRVRRGGRRGRRGGPLRRRGPCRARPGRRQPGDPAAGGSPRPGHGPRHGGDRCREGRAHLADQPGRPRQCPHAAVPGRRSADCSPSSRPRRRRWPPSPNSMRTPCAWAAASPSTPCRSASGSRRPSGSTDSPRPPAGWRPSNSPCRPEERPEPWPRAPS